MIGQTGGTYFEPKTTAADLPILPLQGDLDGK
jgi:hypothetical protein